MSQQVLFTRSLAYTATFPEPAKKQHHNKHLTPISPGLILSLPCVRGCETAPTLVRAASSISEVELGELPLAGRAVGVVLVEGYIGAAERHKKNINIPLVSW